MESPSTITILFTLLLANLFLLASSSSHNNNNINDFLECLSLQLQTSNSPHNINNGFPECESPQPERIISYPESSGIISHPESSVIHSPHNASYSYFFQLLGQNLRPATSPDQTRPAVIVTPADESQIQSAIYCAKKHDVRIKVRSGGHDFEGLSFVSDQSSPFALIDMINLQSISIDTDEKTAWVQAGATIGQFYYTIAQHSKTLAFTAGTCPTVGIGGHFSGGGYGMLSRKYALAADNIIDAKIINIDGKILDRESMGDDMFWAVRGGGGTSFGIVIAFKVKLLTVPETVTVFNVTRTLEENATELVHKWQYIADKLDEDLMLRVFLTSEGSAGNRTTVAAFNAQFLGGADDLIRIIHKEFPELGVVKQDCIEMSWIDSVLFFANFYGRPHESLLSRVQEPRVYYKGKSDYVRDPIPEDGLRRVLEYVRDKHGSMLQLAPHGGAMNAFSESETPFPHRSDTYFIVYVVNWNARGNSDAEEHIEWVRRVYDFMTPYVTKSPRAQYFNCRDLDIGMNNLVGETSFEQASIWGYKYFKNNFDRLVRIKTKFDATNFFKNEQSIPPLS